MLSLGATKVELGVQSTRDELLSTMNRGHTVEDSVKSNWALREAGLKVGFHMMPGLPGSTPQLDLEVFRDLFSDCRFRPDYLKIYPTLVVEGTEAFSALQKGRIYTSRRRRSERAGLANQRVASWLCQTSARAKGYSCKEYCGWGEKIQSASACSASTKKARW